MSSHEAAQSENEKYKRGVEKRASLFGPQSKPGGGGTQALAPYYSRWILESVFGDLWSRPALGDKTRILITMTAMVVSHQYPQLKGYFDVALRAGWTREEIVEALVHLAPYTGVPTVHNALDVFQSVLAEQGRQNTGN